MGWSSGKPEEWVGRRKEGSAEGGAGGQEKASASAPTAPNLAGEKISQSKRRKSLRPQIVDLGSTGREKVWGESGWESWKRLGLD